MLNFNEVCFTAIHGRFLLFDRAKTYSEKPRYCRLNSNKMDGSDENGMAIKTAERSEEWHGNSSSENNTSETAMAMAQVNQKPINGS